MWDADGDGISNLDELLSGSDPYEAAPTTATDTQLLPVDASIERIADKTIRMRWEPSSKADYYRLLENPDGNSGYEPISDRLGTSVTQLDHRVARYRRINARYMVEACNDSGCTYSVQQLVEALDGNMEAAIGYIKSDNPFPSNRFGGAISISADGKTLAVGEAGDRIPDTGPDGQTIESPTQGAGVVHVFTRTNNQWVAKAPTTSEYLRFGSDVTLNTDGSSLGVSGPNDRSAASGIQGDQTDMSRFGAGAVYLY